MASLRAALLLPALALAAPAPAEATLRVGACGHSVPIEIPLDRHGDGKHSEKCSPCHAAGCDRSRRARRAHGL